MVRRINWRLLKIMDNRSIKVNKIGMNLFFIISALALHVLSMYLVVFLQKRTYSMCTASMYLIIKFILRWFYLLVPACFMRIEHITLKDIGIVKNKVFTQVIIGLLIGSVAAIAVVGLTILLGFKEQLGQPLYEEGWQYIIYFFYTIFAVGLFEEIFFRGYIYYKLLDMKESKWFAIIISSVIFGVCHFVGSGSFWQNVPQVLLSMIIGIFYCVLREKIPNCSLISLIFMHGIYDFFIAFLVFAV